MLLCRTAKGRGAYCVSEELFRIYIALGMPPFGLASFMFLGLFLGPSAGRACLHGGPARHHGRQKGKHTCDVPRLSTSANVGETEPFPLPGECATKPACLRACVPTCLPVPSRTCTACCIFRCGEPLAPLPAQMPFWRTTFFVLPFLTSSTIGFPACMTRPMSRRCYPLILILVFCFSFRLLIF